MEIKELVNYLKNYDGKKITIMEVCGSHTAAIAKNGIRAILSDKINLISGPGCPVCVTPSAYIDKLIELSLEPNTVVATFGDLIRVPGSTDSLQSAKSRGAKVAMVYSPLDVINLAKENPDKQYVFAAVGFETTTPVYTILLDQAIKNGLENIKLLTALKTMPEVISMLLKDEESIIDGFIAPGHVCAVTGYEIFEPLCETYNIPFSVSGFEGEELIIAIYGLVKMIVEGRSAVENYYTSAVSREANPKVMAQIDKYYTKGDATWRGVGLVKNSGMYLKDSYKHFDAGSFGLDTDIKKNAACKCGEILKGKAKTSDCPLFKKVCTPQNPQGACMVSYEGGCYHAYEES